MRAVRRENVLKTVPPKLAMAHTYICFCGSELRGFPLEIHIKLYFIQYLRLNAAIVLKTCSIPVIYLNTKQKQDAVWKQII